MQRAMRHLLEHKAFVLVALVYTALLTVGSLIKTGQAVTAPQNFDKVLHLLAYLGLGLLWMLWGVAQKPETNGRYPQKLWLIALLVVFYGIFIELLQGILTTYRTPDAWDILANTIGVVLALLVVLLLLNKTSMLKTKF